MGVGRAIAMRSISGGKKKGKKADGEAAQEAPPKRTSPIVAWIVLIAVWFLTILPMSTGVLGNNIAGWITAIAGLFVLKALLLNKLQGIFR